MYVIMSTIVEVAARDDTRLLDCGIMDSARVIIDYSPTTLIEMMVVNAGNRREKITIDLNWTEAKVNTHKQYNAHSTLHCASCVLSLTHHCVVV